MTSPSLWYWLFIIVLVALGLRVVLRPRRRNAPPDIVAGRDIAAEWKALIVKKAGEGLTAGEEARLKKLNDMREKGVRRCEDDTG